MRLQITPASLILMFALSLSAHAAPRKKPKDTAKKKPLPVEIYQATEGEIPAPESTTPIVTQAKVEVSPPASAGSPGQVALVAQGPGFDSVPNEYRDSILRRLKLVEQLVHEHGRAYDYRMVTTQNLESILRQLKAEKSQQNQVETSEEAEQDI